MILNLKKILDLLSENEKKKLFLLLFFMVFVALFDVIGVASIMPFIALLSNTSVIYSNHFLASIYEKTNLFFGVNDENSFLFLVGIFVFILFVLSTLLRALTNYFHVKFAFQREHSIGKKLLFLYLSKPYEWFLNQNSSELGKSILSEVQETVSGIILPLLNMTSQILISTTICIFLFLIEPIITLFVFIIIMTSYFVIFFLLKNILIAQGQKRLLSNSLRFKKVSEIFSSIKEIKLSSLEKESIDNFSLQSEIYARSQIIRAAIILIPRYFIEALIFGGGVLFILFLILNHTDFESALPTLSIYAIAGYRLMPSFQQIYNASAQIKFSMPSLVALHKNFQKDSQGILTNKFSDLEFDMKIKLSNISYKYSESSNFQIKDLNIEIQKSKKTGIVGLTGSGKTTILDILIGLLHPNKGSIQLDDITLNKENLSSYQKLIAYVPQDIYLIDSTIYANIAFVPNESSIKKSNVERVSKVACLDTFIKTLPDGYNTIVGERGVKLSGGQKQRIGIARALYKNPNILVLDEATSALDNITEKQIIINIENFKKDLTTVLIAHRFSSISNCDNIYLMNNGRLVASGNFDELYKNNNDFRKLSGN